MASVTLQNLTKTYAGGQLKAVNGVSLDIEDGEFLVLVGPSGCGKSTALRMIAGLEEISDGAVWIGDDFVNDVHPKDRDIAMVFQSYALYPHMTVYDNIAFPLQIAKLPKAEIDRRVQEAARILELEAYLKRRVLDPIGMRVARWNSKDGGPNLPSGAHATAREWVKFGLLLKNGGRWNGKQIIGRKLLEELTAGSKANGNYGLTCWLNRSHSGEAEIAGGTRRLRRLLGGDEETGVVAASKYGVDAKLPNGLYMAAGGGNQRLYIIPSHDLVVVRQGRLGEWDDREFLTLLLTGRSAK